MYFLDNIDIFQGICSFLRQQDRPLCLSLCVLAPWLTYGNGHGHRQSTAGMFRLFRTPTYTFVGGRPFIIVGGPLKM